MKDLSSEILKLPNLVSSLVEHTKVVSTGRHGSNFGVIPQEQALKKKRMFSKLSFCLGEQIWEVK